MELTQFNELIQFAREGRNLEFKQSTSWNDIDFKQKIIKSILAMSNIRDGGVIVIGISENKQNSTYERLGMMPEDLKTYSSDTITSSVGEYADPYAKISVDKIEQDGRFFVLIQVSEFEEIPVICKRDGGRLLKRGCMYTRSYRMPETTEVWTQTELREILEMATDKGIKKYLERQSRIGLKSSLSSDISGEEKYLDQLGSLVNTTIEKIISRGYWRVHIIPIEYEVERIPSLAMCKDTVRDLSVHYRGWDYPHYNTNEPPTNGLDYIEQSTDWEGIVEYLRYYQNGQFIHYFGMWEDWQDLNHLRSSSIQYKQGEILSILNAVYQVTEIYEFASRLALKGFLGKQCKISISLNGTKARRLVTLDPFRHLFAAYVCAMDAVPREVTISTEDLISNSADLALDHIVWMFQRFNWDHVSKGIFIDDQNKLIKQRT